LSDNFPIQNALKQGDALTPLLFNFSLEYTIRMVQENQVGLELNGTHQLLVYADDVSLLVDNIDTRKKNTQTLIDTIITFLDIIQCLVFCLKCRPVYISKHNVSENGFCLRLQVKFTQFGPIDRASPCLRTRIQSLKRYLKEKTRHSR
jgi:hypothetical protein